MKHPPKTMQGYLLFIRNGLSFLILILLISTLISAAKSPLENPSTVEADTELFTLLQILAKDAPNGYSQSQLDKFNTNACRPFKVPAERLGALIREQQMNYIISGFGNLALDAYIEIFGIGGFSKAKRILELIKGIKDAGLGGTAKAELKSKLEAKLKEELVKKYGESEAAKKAEELVKNLIGKLGSKTSSITQIKYGPKKNSSGCTETMLVKIDLLTFKVEIQLTATCDCTGKNQKSPKKYSALVRGVLTPQDTPTPKNRFKSIKRTFVQFSGRCCGSERLNKLISTYEQLGLGPDKGFKPKGTPPKKPEDLTDADCTKAFCLEQIKELIRTEELIKTLYTVEDSQDLLDLLVNKQTAILQAYAACKCDGKLNGKDIPAKFIEIFKRSVKNGGNGMTYFPPPKQSEKAFDPKKQKQSLGPQKENFSIDPNTVEGLQKQNIERSNLQQSVQNSPQLQTAPSRERLQQLNINNAKVETCDCYKTSDCRNRSTTDFLGRKTSLAACRQAGGQSARRLSDNQCLPLTPQTTTPQRSLTLPEGQ